MNTYIYTHKYMHIDIDVHIHRHSHKHIHIHRHRTLADSTKLGIRPPELNVRHGRSCCQHKKSEKNQLNINLSYTSPEAHASASRILLELANALLRLCQDH